MISEEEMLSEMLAATCFDQELLKDEWYKLHLDKKYVAYTLFDAGLDDALYCIEDAARGGYEAFDAYGQVCYSEKAGMIVVMPYGS